MTRRRAPAMPETLVEKIAGAHAVGGTAPAGATIQVDVDVVVINDGCGPLAFEQFRRMGVNEVADRNRVVLVNDHFAPAPTLAAARLLNAMRQFADEQRIPHFYDLGSGGIEHALLPEKGLVRPGDLVFGGDSHTCTIGAFGAVGIGVGSTDIAGILALGRTWMRVPHTRRWDFVGHRPAFVTGKDLVLQLLGRLGPDGASGEAIECGGPALAGFNLDDRMALCNMAPEGGAKTALVIPDQTTEAWAESVHGSPVGIRPDDDAVYVSRETIDVTALRPMVARPPSPADAVPIDAVAGLRVDHVYIGNCANGTISDLRQTAAMLRGHRVAKGVRLIVVPATQAIYRQALSEGLLEVFVSAGATVASPGCGACFGGHMGLVDAGEVVLANINRNYHGRMGHPNAQIYLANSYVAAAAAVAGRIIDPAELLRDEIGVG